MTAKVDITPDADTPMELLMGYHKLLLMLKWSNAMCVFLLVIPLTIDSAIVELENILSRISALMRHFTSASRIKEKTCSARAMSGLGLTEILR